MSKTGANALKKLIKSLLTLKKQKLKNRKNFCDRGRLSVYPIKSADFHTSKSEKQAESHTCRERQDRDQENVHLLRHNLRRY
ncbi:hypothetical protein ACQUQP_00820 [Marinobacterium sp. YM272]|uniref:hypothetical protein n=1 Tax=Marinobacterium sp. YM272 TaxID=3421654 RepID=UPI003D7F7F2B